MGICFIHDIEKLFPIISTRRGFFTHAVPLLEPPVAAFTSPTVQTVFAIGAARSVAKTILHTKRAAIHRHKTIIGGLPAYSFLSFTSLVVTA
jgi:hypothetical protein